MNTEMMRIRVPQPMKAWLDTRAKENGRSMNAELVDLLKPVMLAEPLEIFISECTSSLGVFFTVSVGQHGDDFHEERTVKPLTRPLSPRRKSLACR